MPRATPSIASVVMNGLDMELGGDEAVDDANQPAQGQHHENRLGRTEAVARHARPRRRRHRGRGRRQRRDRSPR